MQTYLTNIEPCQDGTLLPDLWRETAGESPRDAALNAVRPVLESAPAGTLWDVTVSDNDYPLNADGHPIVVWQFSIKKAAAT